MKRLPAVLTLFTAFAASAAAELDPLDMRWTFGAHEPFPMYRRVGRHCTGGIDGNAEWLRPWLNWWDAESPKLMKELGLNWLHSRFYKGMGWENEKKDFPNVRKFVANCHANGVRALAYVQFLTLYPEVMRKEIPEIDSWKQKDALGQPNFYWHNGYFRHMPCICCQQWLDYLKKMCTIALTEGGFDGIMFDNFFAMPCYCERCQRKFREYLQTLPDREERFGFDDVSEFYLPVFKVEDSFFRTKEVRDPAVQAWIRWREETLTGCLKQLRAHIKSVKPDAYVSANCQPFRSFSAAGNLAVDMIDLANELDIIINQNAYYPSVADGCISSRVRELKMARELGRIIVSLCDSDAMMTPEQEKHYLLPLYEDLVFGGVPTDRTVVSPKAVPGFIDREKVARRRPQLEKFNAFVAEHRASLKAPVYQPVRLFYPYKELHFSVSANRSLAVAEEILNRRQIPWGYLVSSPEHPFDVPAGTEVIVVAGQIALSSAQVEALVGWAQRGGKLVVTGDAGRYSELNAQHLVNPFLPQLKGLPNVAMRATSDEIEPAEIGWSMKIGAPKDHGEALLADLAKTGFTLPFETKGLPETVVMDVRRGEKGFVFHFVNYNPSKTVEGARVRLADGTVKKIAPFSEYAIVE